MFIYLFLYYGEIYVVMVVNFVVFDFFYNLREFAIGYYWHAKIHYVYLLKKMLYVCR